MAIAANNMDIEAQTIIALNTCAEHLSELEGIDTTGLTNRQAKRRNMLIGIWDHISAELFDNSQTTGVNHA